jgi:hypothetical protein
MAAVRRPRAPDRRSGAVKVSRSRRRICRVAFAPRPSSARGSRRCSRISDGRLAPSSRPSGSAPSARCSLAGRGCRRRSGRCPRSSLCCLRERPCCRCSPSPRGARRPAEPGRRDRLRHRRRRGLGLDRACRLSAEPGPTPQAGRQVVRPPSPAGVATASTLNKLRTATESAVGDRATDAPRAHRGEILPRRRRTAPGARVRGRTSPRRGRP